MLLVPVGDMTPGFCHQLDHSRLGTRYPSTITEGVILRTPATKTTERERGRERERELSNASAEENVTVATAEILMMNRHSAALVFRIGPERIILSRDARFHDGFATFSCFFMALYRR